MAEKATPPPVHYISVISDGHICGVSAIEDSTYLSDQVTCQKCRQILAKSRD